MIIPSLCFLLLTVMLFFLEKRRTNRNGPDLLSIFFIVFALQNVIPGIVIPVLIEKHSGALNTQNDFFNRVYQNLSPGYIYLSVIMCFLFVFAIYISYYAIRQRYRYPAKNVGIRKVKISLWRLWLVMALGVMCSILLLKSMGQHSLIGAYQALVSYRTGQGVARTFVNANLFSLTQSFSLLSIVPFLGIVGWPRGMRRSLCLIVAALGVVFFALMCVSRRALPLDVVFIYFTLVIVNRKWYLKFVASAFAMFMPFLVYGKIVLYSISMNKSLADTLDVLKAMDVRSSILSGFSYLGISLDSSWASFLFLNIPYRFGVDHLLSIVRRIPLGSLGDNKDLIFPERIVRISTKAFVGADASDIPPGLVGQMWLDFGIFGPLIWGCVFGAILCYMQNRFDRNERTFQSTSLFILLLYIVTLPLNTGSFDYVFSVDNIFLLIFIYIIYKKKKYTIVS